MNIAVLGQGAELLNAAARQRGATMVPVAADDALSGSDWVGVVVDGSIAGAATLTRAALAAGLPVLAAHVPADEAWTALVAESPAGLALSRPLRFDPHIARSRDTVVAGTLGRLRTLEIGWSFAEGSAIEAAAGYLIDIACHLLGDAPAAIYALACDVAGPPLIKLNLLTITGSIAVLEATIESAELPTRRDIHLIATDGELVHRLGNDDLLWSQGRVERLPPAIDWAELRTLECAAWLGEEHARLAQGAEVGWNLAISGAVRHSLATGEMVKLGQETAS